MRSTCRTFKRGYRVMPNQSFQPTSHSSLRSSCAAAELHRYASEDVQCHEPEDNTERKGGRGRSMLNFESCKKQQSSVAPSRHGSKSRIGLAVPSSRKVVVLMGSAKFAKTRRPLCTLCQELPEIQRNQLTHNQSLQPTSHSSLRSSCAAADLQRWASVIWVVP